MVFLFIFTLAFLAIHAHNAARRERERAARRLRDSIEWPSPQMPPTLTPGGGGEPMVANDNTSRLTMAAGQRPKRRA